jgi:DNA-binding FadR family transcriptional regulator
MSSSIADAVPFSAVPVLRPRQQVESQLRRAILDGTIPEGTRLPSETDLASSFGVSRATIREALRSLIEGGLLEKGTGTTSGLYVQSVDHRGLSRIVSNRLGSSLDVGSLTFEEIAMFRDLLETPSARLAADNRTGANLKKLHDIIDEERAVTFDDPIVPELNARFHVEIANATGNRVLASFVAALHQTAHPLAFVSIDAELGRVSVTHHIKIYKAIEAKNAEDADRQMRSHLAYLREHAVITQAESSKVHRLPAILP